MAQTWTHIAARAAVRPLLGTGVTPNHLTTLRLLTGIGACAALATGTRAGAFWAGGLWLLSAFLDRADGELARIGGMSSEAGHKYDYVVDMLVNSLLFTGAGIGVQHEWLGVWAIPLGLVCTISMLICWIGGETYEQLGSGEKTFSGAWGFDLDDALYLLAPLIWFRLMSYVVFGAAIVTSVMAALTVAKLLRLRTRLASRL